MTEEQERFIAHNVSIICNSHLVSALVKTTEMDIGGDDNNEGKSTTPQDWDNGESYKQASNDIINNLQSLLTTLENKFTERILGQDEMIHTLLLALILNEHVLLEGLPGVGKTEIVKWVAHVTGLPFTRIQFIPDMLPSDLVGKDRIDVAKLQSNEAGAVEWVAGPVFSSLVLADEINRAPSKVQAALLEAMGEKQVTPLGKAAKPVLSPLHQAAIEVFVDQAKSLVGSNDRGLLGVKPPLPLPERRKDLSQFTVFATMNPIEQEGTYPLSEAQMDRFCFKTLVPYPSRPHYIGIQSAVHHGTPFDAAEINLPLEVCREYFNKHPKQTIPVLMPVYFFLRCRADLLPTKVDGRNDIGKPSLGTLAEEWTPNPQEQHEGHESEMLQLMHDITYMTNARRRSSGDTQADSSWFDREQVEIMRYIQAIKDPKRKARLLEIRKSEHCQYVKAGASPRAFLKLVPAALADALCDGNDGQQTIQPRHIARVAPDILRHRIHMDVHARLAHVTSEDVIHNVCEILMESFQNTNRKQH